ncbi:4Fe-4S binding protein [Neobacillus pocheonensis]|uniref:4Fe-4S binding protein n=1 Tax=Neobacillus pocheonensis TaxID=363869 RepID=UPI003D293DD3
MLSLSGAYFGIVSGSCVVFGLLFISSFIVGRGFCGWLCPAGGMQESFSTASGNKRFHLGKKNGIKYALWIPWFSSIIVLFLLAAGEKKIQFFYQLSSKISILEEYALFVYFSLTLLIIVLTLTFGKRVFCHIICWMSPFMVLGNIIKNRLKIPSLHLKCEPSVCSGCNLCTKNCSMSLDVKKMVQKGDINHSECILCGECVDSCPKKAIRFHFGSH